MGVSNTSSSGAASIGRLRGNPLLVKNSVGKTRPSVYDLPGIDHVYGKQVERDPEECAAQGNFLYTIFKKWVN